MADYSGTPKVRKAERTAYCRICSKAIKVGKYLIHFYTPLNRGHNIYLCLKCAKELGQLAESTLGKICPECSDD